MKAIAFLGITDYKPVTYVYKDPEGNIKECLTELFPEALCTFFNPDELLVVVTEKAKEKHFDNLCKRLKEKRVYPVDIPDGKNTDELWLIFDELIKKVDEGDEVVFDITYAFRSIPFLVFLATAFLRSARGVKIKAITYGAYDADPLKKRAPVFDLSPFIDLLDWTMATDKFLKTGNPTHLCGLLENIPENTLPSFNEDKDCKVEDLPIQLKNAAEQMKSTYSAMSLARAEEVMEKANGASEQLETSRIEVERWAKPFSLLLDKTSRFYQPFALENPRNDIRKNLLIQLDLIKWHLEMEQIVQASILSREWLVTLIAYLKKKDIIKDRGFCEGSLNNSEHNKKQLFLNLRGGQEEEIIELWRKLRPIRNDLAHVGNREDPLQTEKLISEMKEIFGTLVEISECLYAPVHGQV
jgi:hypothetical protein